MIRQSSYKKTKALFLRVSATALCLFSICERSMFGQEFERSDIPHYLEAVASAWNSKLEHFAKFEFRQELVDHAADRSSSGENVARTTIIARGLGFAVIRHDAIRISIRWDPLDPSGNLPMRNFDYASGNGIRVLRLLPGTVRINKGFSPDAQTDLRIFSDDLYVETDLSNSFENCYPLYLVPNVFAFCGAWNNGAVFGGLELGKQSSDRFRLHFDEHGFKSVDGISISTRTLGDHKYRIEQKQLRNDGSQFVRSVAFNEVAGIPIRVLEEFESKDSNNRTSLIKRCTVDDFRIHDGLPIPYELKVYARHKIYGKGKELVRKFSVIPNSVRAAEDSDFVMELPAHIPPHIQYIVGDSSEFSVVDVKNKAKQTRETRLREIENEESFGSNSVRPTWDRAIFKRLRNVALVAIVLTILFVVLCPSIQKRTNC